MKRRVGVIFGGRSGEHEVSIVSAANIAAAMDAERFEPVLIGIDKEGLWRVGSEARPLLRNPGKPSARIDPQSRAVLPVAAEGGGAALRDRETGDAVDAIDVFFPIAHGTFGEDGSLQGLLRLIGAPFAGAGVLGSAVGMDKDVMKRLLRQAGLPTPRSVCVRAHERGEVSFDVLEKRLGAPLFVKPCNLGSSVGVHRVERGEDFEAALEDAFAYDRKAIIEECVRGRELECAVLGNVAPKASVVGEVIPHARFYSYKAKYSSASKATTQIPADLGEDVAAEVRALAVRTFEALDCRGFARVDFFLTDSGEALVNEINTLPGFTAISMFPKLWEASGLAYRDLITRLIELADEEHAEESALRRDYRK